MTIHSFVEYGETLFLWLWWLAAPIGIVSEVLCTIFILLISMRTGLGFCLGLGTLGVGMGSYGTLPRAGAP